MRELSPLNVNWFCAASKSSLVHALAAEEKTLSRAAMKQILNAVQCNDLSTPVRILLNERQKIQNKAAIAKTHYSLYRDILFFAFVAIGRENIDHGSRRRFVCA